MKPKLFRRFASFLTVGGLSAISFANHGFAATYTKADNTTVLNLASSWGGTAPGGADIANWSGTYNTAGSLGALLPGGAISWQGVTVGALSGSAAGIVSIGGTGAAVSGSNLSIGSAGINLTGASHDVVINSEVITLSGSQTWTIPSGRNLRFAATGTGAINSNLDATGGDSTIVTVTGGGVVDANQGLLTGFTDYTGKWIVGPGTTLRGGQSGTTAWGTNTSADAILLNGGKLAVGGITGSAGNWTWSTPITLGTATTSTISGQHADTSTRTLALQGAISGDGNLIFEKVSGGVLRTSVENENNSYTGTTTINSGTVQPFLGLTGGTKTPLGTGDITVNSGAILEFKTPSASTADITVANNINLNSATLQCRDAFQSYIGNITLTGANTIQGLADLKHTRFEGVIADGASAGSVTLRSLGTQQLNLPFANTYSGGTTIGTTTTNAGVVLLGDEDALGTGTVNLRGGQVWADFDGFTLANPLTVGAGGLCVGGTNDIIFTSPAVVDNGDRPFQNNGTAMATIGAIDLSSGVLAVANFGKGSFTVQGPVTGAGKIVVKAGNVDLSGTHTFSGGTTVQGSGRLNLTGTLSSAITMTGGIITGSGSTSAGFTASGGTIQLDPATPTVALTAGAVNFSGPTSVSLLSQQALGTTTYRVINYGTLTNFANLTTTSVRGTFTNDTVNKRVTLAVTSANRTWSGASSTVWNTTDTNWAEGDFKYFNGDAVTFGNAGAGPITIAGTLTPFSVSFNNSSGNDFTLTSSTNNLISGPTGLTKSGTGTVSLVGENKFTGKTSITGGTLSIRNENNLGTLPASPVTDQITLNGGVLKLAPVPAGSMTISANRGITLGASGGTLDTSALTSGFTATIAPDMVGNGPLTIFSNGDVSDTGGGIGGATLLTGINDFIGQVTIKSGVVSIASFFGDLTNTVVLDGGGLVDQNDSIYFNQNILVGAGGGILRSYGAASTTFAANIANAPSVASTTLKHTDGGTQTFVGDGSGFSGTFINARGNANFDSPDWSGMDLVNVDGAVVRWGSGLVSKVKSITTDNDMHIDPGTILDITSGNFNVQSGTTSTNFTLQNDGVLTSSSGTLNFNFLTPFTATGADNQSVSVLIEDYDAGTPLSVVKNGPGSINNFNKANTYTGGTTINDGRINAGNVDAFGLGNVTVNSGGQVYLSLASAVFPSDMTLSGIGPAESVGNLGALRFQNNNASGNLTIAPSGARVVAYNGATGTLSGALLGSGNLEVNSASTNHNGTVTMLADASAYTGTINVTQGRLNLESLNSNSITVQDGATIGGEGIITGTLTLGSTAGANLRVPGATSVSLETDALVLNGVTSVYLDTVPVPLAPLTVVKYNSKTGGIANLQMAPGSLYRGQFVDTGTTIDLEFIAANRTWAGTVDGNWNSTTLNWVEGDKKFFAGDSVLFDNTASNKSVVIPSPVSPATVLFNHSSGNDYNVTGRMITTSLTKQGTGTLTLVGTPSIINGPVQIDGGTLVLGTTDYLRALGPATGIIVNGGTLKLNGTNVLFDGGGSNDVTVNAGATVELNAFHSHFKTLFLNGGTITGIRSDVDGRFNNEYSTFDTAVTVGGTQMSVINRIVGGTGTYSFNGAPFDVGNVASGTDLLFSAPVVGVALVKNGAGTMELTQANSYAGPTTINAGTILANNTAGSATGAGAVVVKTGGTLGGTGTASGAVTVETGGTLAPGASIESLATGALNLQSGSVFLAEINSSGVPTADQAIVTGNVTLAGDLNGVDIAGSPAAITVGTKLTLISYTGTLTGEFVGKPEGSTFSIGINSFKIRYNDTKKVTLEAMGGSASDYDTWAAIYAPLGAATADDDADGLTNSEEYAFGLHPKSGSSVSPITVQPNKTTGTFTYTRRKPSLTGLTYKVWTSANLSAWTEDTTAIQTPTDVGDNQSVQVTLSGTKPLAAAKLFVRVTAE